MPEERPKTFRAALTRLARRQLVFAAILFAVFVALVVGSGKPWSWSLLGTIAAVGLALGAFAGLIWLSLQIFNTLGDRRP